jgi:hypothetical protein
MKQSSRSDEVAESVTRIRIGWAGKTRGSSHPTEFPKFRPTQLPENASRDAAKTSPRAAWLDADP